jgi:ParB family chromosome partitioning protein
MTQSPGPGEIKMIPVERIDVLNPRERNQKIFDEIVENIKVVGLKKPISVIPRQGADGIERYLLVCGEGRLKAFKLLGESHIPALVGDGSEEDAFIKSLIENIAKTKRRPLEILAAIQQLRDTGGYNPKEIAEKTGLNLSYVHGVLTLLQQGEERLLVAVEKGRVPLTAAMTIAGAGDDDKAIQAALQDAYETGKLRGQRLHHARRIIEHRKAHGRTLTRHSPREKTDVSTSSLVRTYQKEVARQRLIVKKAEFAQQRLLFIVEALRQLYADENFGNLLRAEGLDTLPKYLADRVWPEGSLA